MKPRHLLLDFLCYRMSLQHCKDNKGGNLGQFVVMSWN